MPAVTDLKAEMRPEVDPEITIETTRLLHYDVKHDLCNTPNFLHRDDICVYMLMLRV